MPGRPKAGVGGMASLISCGGALLIPGVNKVRPKLLGFRFCGVGGFTKAGEAKGATPSTAGRGRLDVDEVALPVFREVLTARFLRLRPFFGGGCFWSSKNGRLSSEVRGRNIPPVNVVGGGDSGEEPGDGSVALESSTVEMVEIGEDSEEADVMSLNVW